MIVGRFGVLSIILKFLHEAIFYENFFFFIYLSLQGVMWPDPRDRETWAVDTEIGITDAPIPASRFILQIFYVTL